MAMRLATWACKLSFSPARAGYQRPSVASSVPVIYSADAIKKNWDSVMLYKYYLSGGASKIYCAMAIKKNWDHIELGQFQVMIHKTHYHHKWEKYWDSSQQYPPALKSRFYLWMDASVVRAEKDPPWASKFGMTPVPFWIIEADGTTVASTPLYTHFK